MAIVGVGFGVGAVYGLPASCGGEIQLVAVAAVLRDDGKASCEGRWATCLVSPNSVAHFAIGAPAALRQDPTVLICGQTQSVTDGLVLAKLSLTFLHDALNFAVRR